MASSKTQSRKHRIGIFGNGDVACQMMRYLKYVRYADVDIIALIPEGKDKPWEQSFYKAARKEPAYLGTGNINKFAGMLEDLDLDLLMGCRSGALVKDRILDAPRVGVTNLHYGDLPRYGGCHTIQHAILNGETWIGVTFHFMTPNFDDGPIINKTTIPIYRAVPGDEPWVIYIDDVPVAETYGRTAYQIYELAQQRGYELMASQLDAALEHDCYDQIGEPLYFKQDSIDFARDRILELTPETTREEIIRHTLAFTFPPIQFPDFKGPLDPSLILDSNASC